MTSKDPTAPPVRREDILVSVCFAETSSSARRAPALTALAEQLSRRFRYWEILVIASGSDAIATEVPNVSNLRVMKVTPQVNHYRRRQIAASEAIGDVIVLTAFEELEAVDIVAMAETAMKDNVALVATRDGPAGLMEPFLNALGRGSGFQLSAASMQTTILPRPLLSLAMSYPDRQLAMRFLPRDAGIPVWKWPCAYKGTKRGLRDLPRRLALMHALMSHLASLVLTIVALFAAFAALGSFVFLVYAIVNWLLRETLAEGWLTLSLSIGGSTLFMGIAIFGLAIGLRRLIDLSSAQDRDEVVGEVSSLDFFADLSRELNVTIEQDRSLASPIPPTSEQTRTRATR